jgi:hypothetical protein
MTGTRRNRAVERTHVFLDSKELSPRDPGNYFWLYGAYEYRLQTPHEEAKAVCFRQIEKLVEKARQWYDESPPVAGSSGGYGNATDGNVYSAGTTSLHNDTSSMQQRLRATSIGGTSDTSGGGGGGGRGGNNASTTPKAHLIWDLISTKKHIGPVPDEGLPQKLGHDIYRYVDTVYGSIIATTFVGLTDNTARRVGRDVYYTKSDDLSRTHYGFHTVDREHLFIVFPPPPRPEDVENTPPGGDGGATASDPDRTAARATAGNRDVYGN